jgi:hypothetical protein
MKLYIFKVLIFLLTLCLFYWSLFKRDENSYTLEEECLTNSEVIAFLNNYSSKLIQDIKVYEKKLGQDISKNKFNNPCVYGSDHHILDKATFMRKLVESLKALSQESLPSNKHAIVGKINTFLLNPKIQENFKKFTKYNLTIDFKFKLALGYIKWNPGNIVPGCLNNDRSDDSKKGFDFPLFNSLTSEEHKILIMQAKSIIDSDDFDPLAFMDIWIILQEEKYSTQEVEWESDAAHPGKFKVKPQFNMS